MRPPRILEWNKLGQAEQDSFFARAEDNINAHHDSVQGLIDEIRHGGDTALRSLSAKFDFPGALDAPLWVEPGEFDEAERVLTREMKSALDLAIGNVRRYHEFLLQAPREEIEVQRGLRVTKKIVPIRSAALYVPQGKGKFPSMLYMLAVPAKLAGVGTIVIASPPSSQGKIDPACLYAARVCGTETILRAGGVQAVAALAYGTESVPAVDKIVGPGSSWVTAAKRILSNKVDVGLPAGPSESIVVAERGADARMVALDILIEAEHGPDSSAFLVTWQEDFAREVLSHIPSLIAAIGEPRKSFLEAVFDKYAGVVLVDDETSAIDLVEQFAPEHLSIQGPRARSIAERITTAGEVLIGSWTPFSLANYACGPNAVLPTGGRARTWSAVGVRDFQRELSLVEADASAFGAMRDQVALLADYEGFPSHAAAIRARPRG